MTARFALLLGGCLVLCAVAPSYPSALVAFFLAGAGNAPFFTATLAARSRYSPPEVRAQVFVFMAAVKVATASAGTALAGAAVGLGPRDLLAAGAAITTAGALTAILDRRVRWHRRRPVRGCRRTSTAAG